MLEVAANGDSEMLDINKKYENGLPDTLAYVDILSEVMDKADGICKFYVIPVEKHRVAVYKMFGLESL